MLILKFIKNPFISINLFYENRNWFIDNNHNFSLKNHKKKRLFIYTSFYISKV